MQWDSYEDRPHREEAWQCCIAAAYYSYGMESLVVRGGKEDDYIGKILYEKC